MTILSRYLTKTYLKMIGTCLGAFMAIYLVIDFLERIDKFLKAAAPIDTAIFYFICKTPEIISQTTPMAVLMGTILTIGTLARNSEITAMRSSGVSLVQIARPLIVTAAAISTLLILMQEFVVPPANEKVSYIEQVVIKKKGIGTFFRQNNIWYRDDNFILQARLFEPMSQTLKGITIWEIGKDLSPLVRVDAESATPAPGGWQLAQVTRRKFLPSQDQPRERIASMPLNLDLQLSDLKVVAKSADDMGFVALWRYCESLKDGGYDTTRYRTLLHAKLSLPFAALVMAFLGIPFSLRDGRSSGIGVGIGISMGIGFTYFVINALLLSLGQAGALPPIAAAWATNLVFASAGLWFTLTVDS